MGDLHVHYGKIEKGSLKVNQTVNLQIDAKEEIMLELIIQLHICFMKL